MQLGWWVDMFVFQPLHFETLHKLCCCQPSALTSSGRQTVSPESAWLTILARVYTKASVRVGAAKPVFTGMVQMAA